ncbi:lipid A core-O-antigen ligase-like enyme [Echinicola vietnamensis DSM 17526]|uniref:Lipid A core-O-antigen ligase-like enyme n=1 Tax=Echinicola vietnamensis (strain DSM 17526 / LMG 23754 / KMM 6221) TaxID=926556 RepID=L0G5B1_ECHVK|nr:lipid A core-O-antigen ligase-like enyme [Echinicola vietnamensis DSM 17526]
MALIYSLGKWGYLNWQGKRSNHMLISFFVLMLAFDFGTSFHTFLTKTNYEGTMVDRLGVFGNSLWISLSTFVIPIGFFLGYQRFAVLRFKEYKWEIVVLVMSMIALFNPMNPYPKSVLIFLCYAGQIFLSVNYIKGNFTQGEALKGVFDGLMVITVLQTVLVIMYPVLGIEAALTFFKGEDMIDYALKREGYTSAVGIFGHPGTLALFSLITAIFFLSSYLNGFKKSLSLYCFLANVFIILLTFSRTTYVTSAIIIGIVLVSFYSKKSFFSVKNLVLAAFGFAALIGVLFLTPLSELFLASDFENQIEVRFSSWFMGYDIWSRAKLLGVGINAHVYYMGHFIRVTQDLAVVEFITTNPIHNIHLIVLAETGIIGMMLWLVFFGSKVSSHTKTLKTSNIAVNIFSLATVGIMISIFVYGFFGWAPLKREMITLTFLIGQVHVFKAFHSRSSHHYQVKPLRFTQQLVN